MKKLYALVVVLTVILLILIGIFIYPWSPSHTTLKNNVVPPISVATTTDALDLTQQDITLKNGKHFLLQILNGYTMVPVVEGLHRPRFMSWSPDHRLFLTDMHDLSDNMHGTLYILNNFNTTTQQFDSITTYLDNLHNPNSVAFYTDTTGITWIYIALTDKLIRYQYQSGDTIPSTPAQVIATFPAYGLDRFHGGWHLTRTVKIHNDKVYVSVGSSCNACEEKPDEIRASIIEMNPDGTNLRTYANGLRNAVGIQWVGNSLFATAMGADHLGNTKPDDVMYQIEDGQNYGWPYCYVSQGKVFDDTTLPWAHKNIDCSQVPTPYSSFDPHSAPLDLKYVNQNFSDSRISNSFLVALHGSGHAELGYGDKVIFVKDAKPYDFITNFQQKNVRFGRPAGILINNNLSFFLSDDFGGILYYVYK